MHRGGGREGRGVAAVKDNNIRTSYCMNVYIIECGNSF